MPEGPAGRVKACVTVVGVPSAFIHWYPSGHCLGKEGSTGLFSVILPGRQLEVISMTLQIINSHLQRLCQQTGILKKKKKKQVAR